MSNNPPPGGENQNWAPQPPPQQYTPPTQPQQQHYVPPTQPQPQPQQYAPIPPPKPASQLNMQNINKMVTSVPQLVRMLRMLAWAELLVIIGLGIIGFCSTLSSFSFYFAGALSALTSLLVTILQAFVFWGLLMGVALLLENQSGGRTGA